MAARAFCLVLVVVEDALAVPDLVGVGGVVGASVVAELALRVGAGAAQFLFEDGPPDTLAFA